MRKTPRSSNSKLAIVSTMAESPWGGSEELWAEYARHALSQGDKVVALLPKWEDKAARVKELLALGMTLSEWREAGTFPETNTQRGLNPYYPYEMLEAYRPDYILVSHGGLQDAVYGHILLIATLLELKLTFSIIVQCNTDYVNFPNDQQREILRAYFHSAENVFFVSQHNLELARRLLASPLPNASVIENPVNLSDISPCAWPHNPTPRFATIARLDASAKGYDILFEALSQDTWKQRKWSLDIYGAGVHERYLHELREMFGLVNRINFCGTVTDIRNVWREHEILLLASRYEGTPLVLLEAMACGRPAVVTDVGGNAEWITDGVNGYLAAAPTPKLFIEALDRAWNDKTEWEQKGIEAHKTFANNHPIKPGKKLYEKLFLVPDTSSQETVPSVSIIIPCYNYSRFVRQCIESVLKQTSTDFEIIFIDDGSTDDSLSVAHSIAAEYPDYSIRIFTQENSGQPAIARNRAIEKAQGEFILCLDADDTIAPQMLQRCLDVFKEHPEASIVYTDGLFSAPDGRQWIQETGQLEVELLKVNNQLFYCSMYRREVFSTLGGYHTNVPGYEDWDFWIGAAKHGFKGIRIPEPLFFYRVNESGMLSQAEARNEELRANLILNHPEIFSAHERERADQKLNSATQSLDT